MGKYPLLGFPLYMGVVILISALVSACSTTQLQTLLPGEKPFSVEVVNACIADEDCILVQANYCGGAEAIHRQHLDRWTDFLEAQRKEFEKTPIACGPSLPMDQFKPRCLNQQCAAVYSRQYGVLAFGADPLVGQAVPLRFELVYESDTPAVQASILLPQGIDPVSGNLEWQGDMLAAQPQTVEAQVKVSRPGCYIVRGRATSQAPAASTIFEPVVYLKVTDTEASFRRQPEAYWEMRYGVPVTENADTIHSWLIFQPIEGKTDRYRLTYRVSSDVDLSGSDRTELSTLLPEDAFSVEDVSHPPGGEVFNHGTQITWQGKIQPGQTVELALNLKLIQPGAGPVFGILQVEPGGAIQSRITDVVVAELYVCE